MKFCCAFNAYITSVEPLLVKINCQIFSNMMNLRGAH